MRPNYESPLDLEREAGTAAIVGPIWNVQTHKNPRFYQIDYSLLRGGIIKAWAEIKWRNYEFGHYPDYMISLHKVMAAIDHHRMTGLPVYLVANFQGDIRYADLTKDSCTLDPLKIGGRKDRDDPQDLEPVCSIPLSAFKPLTTGENHGKEVLQMRA